MTLDEWKTAEQGFWRFVNNYENLAPEVQSEIDSCISAVEKHLDLLKEKRRAADRQRARSRQETTRARKAVRDELIPAWCEENLKPGMVVKVKANSATKFREIESVKPGSTMANGYKFDGYLTGRHVRYVRRRDLETLKFADELTRDGYITDHVFKNVQGVVTGVDERGKPIVTPIMELIEGVKE